MNQTDIRHMWCGKCNDFTPHFIHLIALTGTSADIECSCSIHDPVILRNKKTISAKMYDEIVLDKFKMT